MPPLQQRFQIDLKSPLQQRFQIDLMPVRIDIIAFRRLLELTTIEIIDAC